MIAADGTRVTVDIVVTLDDQVRFLELVLSAPALRRIHRRRWAVTILLMPPFGLVLGVLIGFLSDAERPPWSELVGTLSSDRKPLIVTWLVIALGLLGVMAAQRLLRGRRLRAQTRMLLGERPGIDPEDPQMRERVRCSFGPEGFRSEAAAGDTLVRWDGVTSLDETPELLVVRTGRFSGFVLPRREMREDEVAVIRQIAAANRDPRGVRPWG